MLLSTDEEFYQQTNQGITSRKVKLTVKCFSCVDGIIVNRDIDRIINGKQNKCQKCSRKVLSEKMTKQNNIWWNDKEYRRKISKQTSLLMKGDKNPNYHPNITDEERKTRRNTSENTIWRESIYKRDGYTCQCCGDNKGGNLIAHHLEGWSDQPKLRYDIKNGITLCDACHKKFHSLYSYDSFSKQDYIEFISLYENTKRGYIIQKNDKSKNKVCNIIGVNWRKREQKWQSRISVHGKDMFIYSSNDINEVILTRLIAEKQYWGNAAPQKHLFDEYNVYDYADINDYKIKRLKIKGVYTHENKWIAMLSDSYIGIYDTYEEAVKARLNKEKELYGDKAPQGYLFDKYNIR